MPQGDWPLPIAPAGPWHYRQSIDYEITNNRAMLDLASRYRETFLYNIYRMGMNSIEKGSKDNWTVTPKRIAALEAAAAKLRPAGGRGGRGRGVAAMRKLPAGGDLPGGGLRRRGAFPTELYNTVLHDPKHARSARLHHSRRSAGFRHRHRVHQRAAQERHHVHEGHRGVQVGGQELSGRFVRRQDRAGVPPARDGYVRAAGSPERFRVSRRSAESARTTSRAGRWRMQMGVQFDRILEASTVRSQRSTALLPPPPAPFSGSPRVPPAI